MSDTKDSDDAPLTLKAPRRLEIKKTVGSGQVRQSFSRGRTKAVQVEVKKSRSVGRGAGDALFRAPGEREEAPEPAAPVQPQVEAKAPAAPPPPSAASQRGRVVLKSLTDDEKAARARAVDGARARDEDLRRRAEDEARRKAEENARLAREHEEAEQRKAEEEARKREEEEAKRKGEETAARKLADPESPAVEEQRAAAEVRARRPRAPEPQRRMPGRKAEPRLRTGRLTLNELEENERTRSLASVRRAREREKRQGSEQLEQKKIFRDVVVPEAITVQELANRMAERAVDVVKALMRMGMMVTVTATIDADTAELLVAEFGHRVKRVSEADVEVGLTGEKDADETLQSRAPVVTVMGHVDHGKTSLLDALRKTDVAAGESGGITQHIGAYQVEMSSGAKITFLDTPGHEAFTAMRARGANVTDIVVLVVAADDGIMPQTVEAIRHAKAANVPIIVAVNKIDLHTANPRKVREALLQHEIVVEEMGGETIAVDVSAKTRQGLDKLEETILLQAEILELKANPDRMAEGAVVEAKVDIGRGPVATVLVQLGTLRVGDNFVAGGVVGRVRALVGDRGQKLESAGPSVPVEVLGFTSAAEAGDTFLVVENEARAREVAAYRQRRGRTLRIGGERTTVEQLFAKIKAGEIAGVPVVVKTDVQGSLEALIGAARKLSTEEVAVRVIHGGVGAINESDVQFAKASGALIIGFNVRANTQARDLANRDGVEIRYYSIIYDVVDDLRTLLTGKLAPTIKQNFIGNAQILEVFNITKVGKIAGCKVTEGVMRRGAPVRLLRDNVVIHEGKLSQLKRFKDDVEEVKAGLECGMAFEKYQDIQVGDVIEAFEVVEIARTL
ncbi:MAG: translation initiation factor IF-2 [Alphaproteobacteria bacterium]|nr:translation initiation factor IF-2 [Alphaproteobacteria bacterium]